MDSSVAVLRGLKTWAVIIALLILLCLIASCSNVAAGQYESSPAPMVTMITAFPSSVPTTVPVAAPTAAPKEYEDKPYPLSDLIFHDTEACYIMMPIEEYLASTKGLVQARVGRIRSHGGLRALDVKVTSMIKGVDMEYMQLLFHDPFGAVPPTDMYEVGKEYIFPFSVLDSLENPEPLFIGGTILYYPLEGTPTYWDEPIDLALSAFSAHTDIVDKSDKSALKALGMYTIASERFEDIADYADMIAIVYITEIEEISSRTSVALGTSIMTMKGGANETIRFITPTGTRLGEALVFLTRFPDDDFHAPASRTNAVINANDRALIDTTLTSIRCVEGVSIEDQNR